MEKIAVIGVGAHAQIIRERLEIAAHGTCFAVERLAEALMGTGLKAEPVRVAMKEVTDVAGGLFGGSKHQCERKRKPRIKNKKTHRKKKKR